MTRLSPRALFTWLVVGGIGWAGVVWLGAQLYATTPPSAGFDLELLLEGGRRVAAGQSPYDPAMVGGASPGAPSLFYSYPPPVAQAIGLVAGVPSPVMLVAWGAAAVFGLLFVADRLRRLYAPDLAASAVLIPVAAAAPLVFPVTVGLLFGNLDVFFPLLYGLMLIAAIDGTRPARIAGGVALTVAALKLHPASLGLWFLVRGFRQRRDGSRPTAWLVVAAAVAAGAVIVLGSLAVGGNAPWVDYFAVIRAGSGADLVDPRNAAPAAQIALLTDGGEGLARVLQVVVSLGALALTAGAAWRRRDPVESLALASIASLVTLPVMWYHYPAALIPFALAAMLRSRGTPVARTTTLVVGAAAVVAAISIVWLPLLWVAIGLLLMAVDRSANAAPTI